MTNMTDSQQVHVHTHLDILHLHYTMLARFQMMMCALSYVDDSVIANCSDCRQVFKHYLEGWNVWARKQISYILSTWNSYTTDQYNEMWYRTQSIYGASLIMHHLDQVLLSHNLEREREGDIRFAIEKGERERFVLLLRRREREEREWKKGSGREKENKSDKKGP